MTGGLAQLGERYNGIVEVIGSSPLSSIEKQRFSKRLAPNWHQKNSEA
jgi:hypothetical protein